MNPLLKIIFGLSLILILPSANGTLDVDSIVYLGEFSETGETCQIVDAFNYQITLDRSIFSYDQSTVPVFYNCYSEDGKTIVIFDIYKQQFLNEMYTSELIDLAYIKANLNNNVLSAYYFIPKGVDICDSFGSSEINQESRNLVAETLEKATPLMERKRARDVSNAISIGKNINVIAEFNPAVFIAGVSCSFNDKLLKKSVESLALCNGYLLNIQQNFAREGYVSALDNCISNAKDSLRAYIKNTLSKVRDELNQVSNVIYGILYFFRGLIEGSDPEIKIEETEMDIAKRIANQISDDNTYLHHPHQKTILDGHSRRIQLKVGQYTNRHAIVANQYGTIKDLKPSFLVTLFVDFFKEPNYNLSLGINNLREAHKNLLSGDELFRKSRFNSALRNLDYVESQINIASEFVTREINIKRNWDYVPLGWIIAAISIIILLKISRRISRRKLI